MLWIIFTLIAMLLWTVVNIMDKYIIGHELRDPILVTTVFGFTIYLLFILVAVLNGGVIIPVWMVIMAMLAGIIYSTGLGFYYMAMKKVEVSRLAPMLSTEPLLISAIAFFVFQERLSIMNYIGILLIITGAVLITHRKSEAKSKLFKFYVFAFVAMMFFALRNILIKYVSSGIDFWPMLFWFGIGGIVVPLVLLVVHHPHIREKAKVGIIHLCFVAILSGLALIFFTKAISLGSVSLVSALMATKPMLVFFAATFLSFFYPKIILERHSRKVLLKKTMAIGLIVAGGIFIIL
ncbi:EamA family transporter [Candidatus Falkowbacteria bacterium]|jgi:bacterial/archaeal transporter family protein|nr:EamA family transporter [Candidatus Falkowbacteria bacterium]MBT6573896.1 EamA family transporter [Candidatus Falkowbacteria bacterium]MBT7348497.1 EamA family transporter [Candidatus Falkowbacteria bacterium]MBT7500838.1 EamA family transporter [Candidatus Falkowbacteria bacterium]